MTPDSNRYNLSGITIRNNLQYGDMGFVLSLHGQVYHQEYGFNHEFEAYVAEGLAEFARVYREGKSCLWIAESGNMIAGCIAILERLNDQAQLRWFLIHPEFRGIKLGKCLMEKAIEFCKNAGYRHIFLWTLHHLDAARAIYEMNGFKMGEQKKHFLWGQHLIEEYFILTL